MKDFWSKHWPAILIPTAVALLVTMAFAVHRQFHQPVFVYTPF